MIGWIYGCGRQEYREPARHRQSLLLSSPHFLSYLKPSTSRNTAPKCHLILPNVKAVRYSAAAALPSVSLGHLQGLHEWQTLYRHPPRLHQYPYTQSLTDPASVPTHIAMSAASISTHTTQPFTEPPSVTYSLWWVTHIMYPHTPSNMDTHETPVSTFFSFSFLPTLKNLTSKLQCLSVKF